MQPKIKKFGACLTVIFEFLVKCYVTHLTLFFLLSYKSAWFHIRCIEITSEIEETDIWAKVGKPGHFIKIKTGLPWKKTNPSIIEEFF